MKEENNTNTSKFRKKIVPLLTKDSFHERVSCVKKGT